MGEQEKKEREASAPSQPKEPKEPRAPVQDASKEREVFVGGIPWNCTQETFQTDFAECGEIEKMTFLTKEDGSSKGVAFITFATLEGVAAALKFHKTEYGKGSLTVRMSSDKAELQKRRELQAEGKTKPKKGKKRERCDEIPAAKDFEVIIKGLTRKNKEEQLRTAFADCGEILTLRMPLNKKNQCLGMAFIAFSDKKGMKSALKLNGSDFEGRVLKVEKVDAEITSTKSSAAPASVVENDADQTVETQPEKKRRKDRPEEIAAHTVDNSEAPKRKEKKQKATPVDSDGEEFTKEDILERTRKNREERKAKRAALASAM